MYDVKVYLKVNMDNAIYVMDWPTKIKKTKKIINSKKKKTVRNPTGPNFLLVKNTLYPNSHVFTLTNFRKLFD